MTIPCPCGSQLDFAYCCELYLNGEKIPQTAEALMRSRYTAYTQANITYIQNTMCDKASEGFDSLSAKQWAESVEWQGLTVIHATTDQVTFLAKFESRKKLQVIYERSQFKKINGHWYYVDGTMPKIKRNEPCPCRSGKKAKHCCFL